MAIPPRDVTVPKLSTTFLAPSLSSMPAPRFSMPVPLSLSPRVPPVTTLPAPIVILMSSAAKKPSRPVPALCAQIPAEPRPFASRLPVNTIVTVPPLLVWVATFTGIPLPALCAMMPCEASPQVVMSPLTVTLTGPALPPEFPLPMKVPRKTSTRFGGPVGLIAV
jgi:hypothetical protein